MAKDMKFTEAMNSLFDLVLDGYGSGHPVLELISDYFTDEENERITDDEIEFAFKFDEEGMTYLLLTLVNWDFFWFTEDCEIDVENANNPEAAKLVAPFVSHEMAMKVKKLFED